MQRYAPQLQGKLVVWFIYFGNDLYDNLAPDMYGYRTPFVREANGAWEMVTHHISPDKWPLTSTANATDYYQKLAELVVHPCSPDGPIRLVNTCFSRDKTSAVGWARSWW